MRYLIAIAVATAWMSSATSGEIYCNKQGRDCSDRPSPGSVAVRVTGADRNASSAAAPATATPSTTTAGDPVANQQQQNAAQAKAREAMQKDLADKRTEQCKKAQEYYQKTIESRLIYREGKDKERVYLSDTEADQARINARLQMDQACGPSG